MTSLSDLIRTLERIAPPELAEDWDNTGLLLGDPESKISRILTCLTLTPDVAREAIDSATNLIVSHHPIMFRPIQKIRNTDPQGRMLLDLMRAQIAVYSPHTSYDNSHSGINQQLAESLHLEEIRPLRTHPGSTSPLTGSGRQGNLPEQTSLGSLLPLIRSLWTSPSLSWVGHPDLSIQRIGIACGSAAEYIDDAHSCGCQLFITGEARFHDALKARELGLAMILLGHYASERPGIENLARQIHAAHPDCTIRPSQTESDPLQYAERSFH